MWRASRARTEFHASLLIEYSRHVGHLAIPARVAPDRELDVGEGGHLGCGSYYVQERLFVPLIAKLVENKRDAAGIVKRRRCHRHDMVYHTLFCDGLSDDTCACDPDWLCAGICNKIKQATTCTRSPRTHARHLQTRVVSISQCVHSRKLCEHPSYPPPAPPDTERLGAHPSGT